ncbi:Chaperone protein DnaJ [bioreactor metagenome]|uniref:Chaperone protein DnaJ n=1 Tax=bioreactor metagenome TaxID=1076179 RepID=A0A645FIE4_9ZZZZ
MQTLDKELKLKIRPGTQPNTLIRLRGEGVPLLRHHGRGDFYVRILLKVPETVSRKAKKLLQDLDEELQEVKQ